MSDTMLLGILRMSWETSTIHHITLDSACKAAADRIENDAKEIATLRTTLAEKEALHNQTKNEVCRVLIDKDKEIERLQSSCAKAGEEIKHLRAQITDQADNMVEIGVLKAKNGELRERMKRIQEVYEKWNKPENYEKLTEDLQVHYDELMGLATDCWQAIQSAVEGRNDEI